jgi:hypothetical protein
MPQSTDDALISPQDVLDTGNIARSHGDECEDGWLSYGVLRCVVWQMFTDVPEMLASSIIMATGGSKLLRNVGKFLPHLHGATHHKTTIIALSAVRDPIFLLSPS